MSDLIDSFNGQLYRIRGNEPLLLDDPQTIWIVKSGQVALFAVKVNDGIVTGTRRYLFSLSAGQALFGTAVSDRNQQRQFLAVPVGETELKKVSWEDFDESVSNTSNAWVALVEDWLEHLNTLLSPAPMPTIQVKAQGQSRLSLNDGQTLQLHPGAIRWIAIREGSVCWMGVEKLALSTTTGFLPLGDKMWLKAVGNVQLATETTGALRNSKTILQGLSQLQVQILEWIDLWESQEIEEERQRLEAQNLYTCQVTKEALGNLASTMGSKEIDFFMEGEPLLVAAGAVGRALGVTIRPPARSENLKRLKEPLEAILRASRLKMRRVLLRDNWWEKDCGPLLGYIQQNKQPVALLPVSARGYEIFDPIQRTRVPIDASVAFTLSPIACMFYRSFPDKALKAVDIFRLALKDRTRDFAIVLLCAVAVTLLGMVNPHATSILLDNAIPDSDRGLLLQVGIGLLAAALGSAVFRLAQGLALLRIETTSEASTQAAVWDRVLNLPVSFFRKYTTGDLLSRVLSIASIRRQIAGTTVISFISGVFGLSYLALLYYYNWKLSVIAVAIALVSLVVTTISSLLLMRKFRPMLELQGDITGQTVQIINGISKIRVAGAEERAFAAWSKKYSQQVKLENSTQGVEDAVVLYNTIIPTVSSGLLFWFTIGLMNEAQTTGVVGGLTTGGFLAFNAAFTTFMQGITDLSNTVSSTLRIVPQSRRLQPILVNQPEVELSKADPGKLIGRITIDYVSFRYRKDGPMTLDSVSIHAEPGEFIALVGGSGSGKSTIFRLLLGFETPEDGAVYYDGQDLSGLDVEAVRRQLGVVLQNGRLTSGSIFENIAGGANVTLDEAWEAARMSGFADDIKAMPMGMHTVISEGGGNISGGQRQRLLIARALVLKPRILLFDEATSALDNKTQAIVSESLDKLEVTRIAIAHRLSTIRNAHRIYVLQAGRVVQQGDFEELAAREGLFAQLMARQMA